MKMGAVDFMTKPIDLGGLERLIKSKTETAESKMKPILIVDDETSMRESLKDWFVESGYTVDAAADGEAALKLIAQKEYGMLIIDLKLPGKSGIDVLKESRKRAPDLKVIIITAYPSVETAVEAMREGAVEYLSKPFALTDLEKLVADNIGPAQVEIIQEPVTRHTIAALLKVLDRAAADSRFLSRMAESPQEALAEYPELTDEEREALIDGDIKKIESWVGTLDKERATWLWCRLSQEKW